MSEPEFQRLQRSFAAHLRNPQRHPAPSGIEERRLTVYRQLFFNNVNGFLEKGFPVLHSLYDNAGWRRLVRTFFDQHACASPYFLEIPEEFVTFLAETYQFETGMTDLELLARVPVSDTLKTMRAAGAGRN